jgi:hypothetical protein
LTISREELAEGLGILRQAVASAAEAALQSSMG